MDERTAAQIVAQSVMIKALIETHPDHEALRAAIQATMRDGFENVTEESQPLIDQSVHNWMNGLRKQLPKTN
jgi:hypothetical protein